MRSFIRTIRERWFPSEAFQRESDRVGWWRLGMVTSGLISFVVLAAVGVSLVVGPGPDEATGTVAASECRQVRDDDGRPSLVCRVTIVFEASDGEVISFGRSYATAQDRPIEVGTTYTVYYDGDDDRHATRKAITDRDRRQSVSSRLLGGAVFGGFALVFVWRMRRGRWPFAGWLTRLSG